jgi:GntR family transcriptional regulator, transcriptional repressor for pyruvate dehydrogenase complex
VRGRRHGQRHDHRAALKEIGQPVRAPKTSELVAEQLRKQVVRGAVKPGEKLPPETQLMKQFGVSRPAIREAFRILEAERLLVVRPGGHGGAQVAAPDLTAAIRYVGLLLQLGGATIDDVYEARKVTEPACAGLLARSRTERDLADLAAVTAELESSLADRVGLGPDRDLWARLTHRFHQLLLERSGSKTLALQGAMLRDIVATHTELRLSRKFDEGEALSTFRLTLRNYKRLILLIEARDAEGARRLWRRHLESAGAYLLQDDLRDKPVVELFG